jgi:hypothetical protein
LEINAKEIEPSDPAIQKEMAEIQHAIYEERAAAAGAGGKRALLKNGPQRFLHRTLLGIGGQFMQQLSGINLITYVSDRVLAYLKSCTNRNSTLLSFLKNLSDFLTAFRCFSRDSMVLPISFHL